MKNKPQLISFKMMVNRLVLDRQTAEEIGNLKQLWLDPEAAQVKGLICSCRKSRKKQKKQLFTWSQIASIGNDGIFVNPSRNEVIEEEPEANELVIGKELWTDTGNKAGKIVDYLLELPGGKVKAYLFVVNGVSRMLDGIYLLPAEAMDRVGEKRAIASTVAVENAGHYREGLGGKLNLETAVLTAQQGVKKLQNVATKGTQKAKETWLQAEDKIRNSVDLEQLNKGTETTTNQIKQAVDAAHKATEKLQYFTRSTTKQVKAKLSNAQARIRKNQ